jgi:hypothetical protein
VLVFVVPAWQHELGNRLPPAAERVLRQADVIELYSLEPDSTEAALADSLVAELAREDGRDPAEGEIGR